jgi:two-component system response regulator FixJ
MSLEVSFAPATFAGRLAYVVEEDTPSRAEFCQTLRGLGAAVQACDDVPALHQLVHRRQPDMIVVGFNAAGPGWVDLVRSLRRTLPGVGVFMRGNDNPDAADVVTALRSGAVDVFHRRTDPRHVVESLRNHVLRPLTANGTDPARTVRLSSLTRREREVLERLVLGKTSKEVGIDLKISSRTVEVHRAQAMKKLGARNGVDLARKFLGG